MVVGTLSWAAPNPAEYSINVHVSASSWVEVPADIGTKTFQSVGPGVVQRLNVTIDGKKYELESDFYLDNPLKIPILSPGDYKAKLVRDVHYSAYEFSQTYEFLFPDNKTRKFIVTGQME